MLIGAMNHPGEEVLAEINWMGDFGLDFLDLTIEPPAAAVHRLDIPRIREELARRGMKVVGHTAFYLPMASSFESIRMAAVEELRLCIDAFAQVGARWVNLHPDRHTPLHPRSFYIGKNLESLRELLDYAGERGVGLMIENLPGDFNNPAQLGELLNPLPDLGLLLDVGHANLLVHENVAGLILAAFGHRLRHVHMHDNKGGVEDLHLPLGAGSINFLRAITALKDAGYDDTITLEVFTPDKFYLQYSRDALRRLWQEVSVPVRTHA